MAAKAGPAHDWPNSGPLPASWKRSDQAGRVFFVHRGRELERDVALIGFRQRPLAPVTAAAPAFARADASLQPALLLSAGGARPPWPPGPAIFPGPGHRTLSSCPPPSAAYPLH